METIKSLVIYLTNLIKEKFTGKITLHLHEGRLNKKVDITKSDFIG